MDITVKTLEPMRLISFRHIGPYHEIGPVFGRLYQWATANGAPLGMAVGIWHDDPGSTPPHELRSDACIVVPESYTPPDVEGAPKLAHIAGGRYAMATHIGSYEGLGDAWQRFIGQAIPAAGYETIDAPDFEMYMNDCEKVPVEEVRTDLYAPIKG